MATTTRSSGRKDRATRKFPDVAVIRRSLGASHTFKVSGRPAPPFEASGLAREIHLRLVSQGGRPGDAAATLRRLIPVRATVWNELRRYARTLSTKGRSVSPGQLAAVLLEKGVDSMERESGPPSSSAG